MTSSPTHWPDGMAAFRRGMRRAGLRWMATVIVLGTLWPAVGPGRAPAEEPGVSEYTVKAAVLLNFARFTEWPEAAFSSAEAPLVLGVLGRDSFGTELEQLMARQPVKGRRLEVRRLSSDQELDQCHVLFVSASERRRYRDILARVGQRSILTVGETDDFPDAGGVLQLFLKRESNTVKFIVNLDAAKPARLKFSAGLLKLAEKVKGRYE